MSGGETDARSLDAFTRCRVPGCEWMVHLTHPDLRCYQHGGPKRREYLNSSEGEIVRTRGFDVDDYNPAA